MEKGVVAWLRNFPHIWAENYRFIYAAHRDQNATAAGK